MKTRFFSVLLTAALFLASCWEKEPIPSGPSGPETPEEYKGYAFSLMINQTSSWVVYPAESVEGITIPFTVDVINGHELEKLDVSAVIDDEFKDALVVDINVDGLTGGSVTVKGTDRLTTDKASFKLHAESGIYYFDADVTVEKAYITCNTEKVQFVDSPESKFIDIRSNVEYVTEITGELADNMSTESRDGHLYLNSEQNYNFDDLTGTLTVKDPKGILNDITIRIDQAGFHGNTYTDSLALVKIYHEWHLDQSMEGGFWGPMDNWLSDAPIGTWFGVWTNSINRRVTHLELSPWNDEMEQPDLWNRHELSIPETIGELQQLRNLILNGKYKGDLPKSLAGIDALRTVEIYGPNIFTCSLEDHPIGQYASQFAYWQVQGVFQGGVPEWFADIESFRFEESAFSGKVPERVVNHPSMQDYKPNAWNGDGTVMYPWLNANAIWLDIDYHTIEIYAWSKYAIWCDVDMPKGVIKVNGRYGEHYEWESQDALIDYLIEVRGYTDSRENTGYPQDEVEEYLNRYRTLFD